MWRRSVFSCFLFSFTLPVVSFAEITLKNEPGISVRFHPTWLSEKPVIMARGSTVPLIFATRRGHTITEFRHQAKNRGILSPRELWLGLMDEEAIKREKEIGSTYWLTSLHMAFGMNAEKEAIDHSKKLVPILHANGFRVGGYVGSTIAYETFLDEKPEAENWLAPFNYWGSPVHYGTQSFRRRPYYLHPGYIDYVKKILRVGITEMGLDLIHFDNTGNRSRPGTFNHPLAIEHFRLFLEEKYSEQERIDRFGFSSMKHVLPPPFLEPERYQFFYDPLVQEFIDFRCQMITNFLQIMTDYIHDLDPEVAIAVNLGTLTGGNEGGRDALDRARLVPLTDVFIIEGSNGASVTQDGRLISNVRDYKIGQTFGSRVLNRRGSPGGSNYTPLSAPEALAFNVEGALGPASMMEMNWKYIRFLRENFQHFKNAENRADVAILRSFPSMSYNNFTTHQSTVLFEQTLIQAKVPFDIIFEQHLNDISKYRVLVLANQESLSDENVEFIRDYVKNGGGLVATELSSLYNEWRKRRVTFGLSPLFNIDPPPLPKRGELPELTTGITKQSKYGDGRVVYVSSVVPSITRPDKSPMRNEYWALPENWEELVGSVRWAAGGEFSLNVDAPLTVLAELQEQRGLGKTLVHLVNYNMKRQPLVKDIQINVERSLQPNPDFVEFLEPGEEAKKLDFEMIGGRLKISLPVLRTYGLVVIAPQKED